MLAVRYRDTPLSRWRRSLALVCCFCVSGGAAAAEASDPPLAAQAGHWIVDPTEPGPDLPPAGRSLFDFLVSEEVDGRTVYRVPFPFSALREKLLARLDTGAAQAPLKQVLIPLGRSLQRTAAAPDFFRFPRVVLAVDGEPAAASGASGMYLKDRLYLGYLERPGVLEVISYNEAAGRFEFQIVKDYRADAEPQVVYARRAVCTACHQNATPIFARPLWSETNAERRIADLLTGEGRDFYQIPVRLGIDIPNAIDDATDRANLIPAVQFFWQQVCGAIAGEAARSCRAQALTFALQYRLSGSLAFARESNRDWRAFATAFESALQENWPDGLLLSDPDIPNRRPVAADTTFAVPGSAALSAERMAPGERLQRQINIESHLDPLRRRPPLAHWQAQGSALRFVTALSEFFALPDLQRLDRHLVAAKYAGQGGGRQYQARCSLTSRPRGEGDTRLSLKCSAESGGFSMTARVYVNKGRLRRGVVDRLSTSDGTQLLELAISDGRLERSPGGARLILQLSRGELHARMADGNALKRVLVSWSGHLPMENSAETSTLDGRGMLELEQDFPLLRQAVAGLGEDALSPRPLRRAAVLRGLQANLGMPALDTCCIDAGGLPPALLADAEESAAGLPAVLAATAPEKGFYQHCARCHRTGERFPPNFLHGEPQQVREKLAHCAERLYLRLQMWSLPLPDRAKTPMPPVHALQQVGMDEQNWRASTALQELQAYVKQLLQEQTGRVPQLDELVARGYENLRACLAQN